ncbi:hypothetical protein TNCV_2670861 [Trichonephila clavipes]|nr:hypothetical protein TNCV_2670861 [Trichonephila clavipes]
MALNNDLTTDMDFQNATLPKSGNSTPERPSGPSSCARLEATKADIRRYTLIVQDFENMISSLRHSNTQDEHDPAFVEMVKQCSMYEDLLEKAETTGKGEKEKRKKKVRERERTEGGGETEKRERRRKETERKSGRERAKPALNGEKGSVRKLE